MVSPSLQLIALIALHSPIKKANSSSYALFVSRSGRVRISNFSGGLPSNFKQYTNSIRVLFLLDCIEAANEEFVNLNNYILFPSTASIIHFLLSLC